MTRSEGELAKPLLAWYERHGRRDLPWQRNPSPYGVWVSEIMLQQTQVATVIAYFERFMASFPDVKALADAPLDQVLHHWSGLGYYARARNLHQAAARVRDEHGGELPRDLHSLQRLPGIGRSTAGAILALAGGQRHPILDGNVKRVLCRYHAVEGWPGRAGVSRRLWDLAQTHTPARRVAEYTQAIMDLGATVCTRARPACGRCPLAPGCAARAQGEPGRYPTPRPARELPVREAVFVLVHDAQGRVLLERRPPSGIWGGLWSLPECAPGTDLAQWCALSLGLVPSAVHHQPPLRHTFTHFRLHITPALVRVDDPAPAVLDGDRRLWYKPGHHEGLGLAAPVARLMQSLPTESEP